MKLSTKGRYSLETMVYLATSKDLVSIRTISEATGISGGYLEQLMIPLRQAGLVISQQGVKAIMRSLGKRSPAMMFCLPVKGVHPDAL